MREPIAWQYLGLCAYDHALAIQEARWHERRLGGPDSCVAVEHPPTITLGRRANRDDVRAPLETLEAEGITCVFTERGGGATYHGPGQLVIYPIIELRARGFSVGEFVSTLEAIMIEIAAAFGVRARRDPRGRGVWTERGKLGAVGVRIRSGISTHGCALNVTTDLRPYGMIVPCGMPDAAVTSLAHEGALVTSVARVVPMAERVCLRLLEGRSPVCGTAEVAP